MHLARWLLKAAPINFWLHKVIIIIMVILPVMVSNLGPNMVKTLSVSGDYKYPFKMTAVFPSSSLSAAIISEKHSIFLKITLVDSIVACNLLPWVEPYIWSLLFWYQIQYGSLHVFDLWEPYPLLTVTDSHSDIFHFFIYDIGSKGIIILGIHGKSLLPYLRESYSKCMISLLISNMSFSISDHYFVSFHEILLNLPIKSCS